MGVVAALGVAAPAAGVVGGETVRESSAPWFASFDGCGGALVAPDRIVTAAHCVNFLSPADLERIAIGGTVRHGIRFAMPPDWRRTNGANRLDDVALIQLDRPVTGVAPGKLGGSLPARGRGPGRGLSKAPSRGAGGIGDGKLREVVLQSLSDRACARNYRGKRG